MSTNKTSHPARAWVPVLTGVAFAVVTVIAFVVLGHATSSPKIGAPAAKIAAFYTTHHSDEQLAAYLLAVSAALLAAFAVACRTRLATPSATWAPLFLGGGMVASASFLLAGTVHLALTESASHRLSPTTLQTLNALDINTGLAFTGGVAIMLLGAAATLSTRSDTLRVLGWAALPLAVINLTPVGVGAFPLTAIWIIATGTLVTRRPRIEPRPATAQVLAP